MSPLLSVNSLMQTALHSRQLRTAARLVPLHAVDASTAFSTLETTATSIATAATDIGSISAWSVNAPDLTSADFAANLFQASLLPYLALLYFLSRGETNTPKLGNFGFQFLLVFVAATIPAGIYAKVAYGDTLANVDYLHGIAESFLTITNLLIISGFRQSREEASASTVAEGTATLSSITKSFGDSLILLPAAAAAIVGALTLAHTGEPSNALSLPTWAVHTSSLLEWLVAMKLIWEHAETSGNPRWKGMTWGMIPSHASGLCACTYHFFYNSPAVISLVSLQAALTIVGNTTMALAAYRIYKYGSEVEAVDDGSGVSPRPLPNSNAEFWSNMFLKSVLLAALVKYGELFIDLPFEPSITAAALLIAIPTGLNIAKWSYRSSIDEEGVETSLKY